MPAEQPRSWKSGFRSSERSQGSDGAQVHRINDYSIKDTCALEDFTLQKWGSFLSDSSHDGLEACNNWLLEWLSEPPQAHQSFPTKAEARINTVREEIEDGDARLLLRCGHFKNDHHLHLLAARGRRLRLKCREDSRCRDDWRSTATKGLAKVPPNTDPLVARPTAKREKIRDTAETPHKTRITEGLRGVVLWFYQTYPERKKSRSTCFVSTECLS